MTLKHAVKYQDMFQRHQKWCECLSTKKYVKGDLQKRIIVKQHYHELLQISALQLCQWILYVFVNYFTKMSLINSFLRLQANHV